MIFFNQRWLTVHWDDEIQAVWMEWKGYSEAEEYRSGLDAGAELVRQKRANRWLADMRLLGPVRQEDQDWSNQIWFPRAIAAGVRYMALVSPQAAVARMSVKRIMRRVKDVELVTSYFDEYAPARAWLSNPTAAP